MTRYATRDYEALGDHYTRHVCAMTTEGLHDKSAIAAELAVRDKMVADLIAALEKMLEANPVCRSHPIGAPGSKARDRQFKQIFAENAARNALSKATNVEE